MRRDLILVTTALLAICGGLGAQTDQPPQNKPAPAGHPAPVTNPVPDDGRRYYPPGAVKCVEIGNFYLRRGNYRGALSRFEEARDTDPYYAPAYLGLGKVYEKLGLKQKALDAYRKYLDALPSDRDAMQARGAQRAIARLEKALKGSRASRGSSN
jgi:tetratricopeptide (TPR) repeat protein